REREMYADVVVQGNRLQLRKRGVVLGDFPVEHLDLREGAECDVVLAGEVMLAGLPADSFTIKLPSDGLAGRLREALAQSRGGAPSFRERLLQSEAVRAAAARTLRHGPRLLFSDGIPVVCRAGDQALEVEGAGVSRRIPYAKIREVKRGRADGQQSLTVVTAD